jgi:hypothetical protein
MTDTQLFILGCVERTPGVHHSSLCHGDRDTKRRREVAIAELLRIGLIIRSEKKPYAYRLAPARSINI